MAVATRGTASNYLQRAPSPSGLADVVDLILDKGLVIDAYVRIAVIGIELITIDARIVIASVDTYLRFAEAVNRLDLTETELAGLPELQEEGAKRETEGAMEGIEEKGGGKAFAKDALEQVAGKLGGRGSDVLLGLAKRLDDRQPTAQASSQQRELAGGARADDQKPKPDPRREQERRERQRRRQQ